MSSDRKRQTRLQGACIYCKTKKVRCDSALKPDNICSNCRREDIVCIHSSKKKRGPRTGTSIRKQSASVQAIIGAVIAEPETYAVPEDPNVVRKMLLDLSYHARSLERQVSRWRQAAQGSPSASAEASLNTLSYLNSDDESDGIDSDSSLSEGDDDETHLSGSLRDIGLISGDKRLSQRHFGKTSNMVMMKTAVKIKKEILGDQMQFPSSETQWAERMHRRPEYWSYYPWQHELEVQKSYIFPENDLLRDLVTAYFTHIQPYIPLLHRPTFERSVAEGLHLRDSRFAVVLLCVCAIASRFSRRDPRNFADGESSEHSLGWPWYKQTLPFKTFSVEPPSLYDLQVCCLSAIYLMGTSASDSLWSIVGLGIRVAQDMGLHRKKKRRPDGLTNWKTVQSELCTRAFWVLLNFDAILSFTFGRPKATNGEDFDLEPPMEIDDEYWENEKPEQPADVPCKISFFVYYCKLMEILGYAHRAIYPTNKAKLTKFMGPNWEQNAVIELDSALNQWSSSLPEFLKWDPSKPDGLFFRQSSALITFFYWTQMQVHGRFLRELPGKDGYMLPTPSSPNMTICMNAARCCVRVIEVQRRSQFQFPAIFVAPVFSTAIILLLCSWTRRKAESASNVHKEMQEIQCCLDIIAKNEKLYQIAGRLHDILRSVISLGDQHFSEIGHCGNSSYSTPADILSTPDISGTGTTLQTNVTNVGPLNGFAQHIAREMLSDEGSNSSTSISSASGSPFSFAPNAYETGGSNLFNPTSNMYLSNNFTGLTNANAPYPSSGLFVDPQDWQMDGMIQAGGLVATSEETWSSFMDQVDDILHSVAGSGDIPTGSDNNSMF